MMANYLYLKFVILIFFFVVGAKPADASVTDYSNHEDWQVLIRDGRGCSLSNDNLKSVGRTVASIVIYYRPLSGLVVLISRDGWKMDSSVSGIVDIHIDEETFGSFKITGVSWMESGAEFVLGKRSKEFLISLAKGQRLFLKFPIETITASLSGSKDATFSFLDCSAEVGKQV